MAIHFDHTAEDINSDGGALTLEGVVVSAGVWKVHSQTGASYTAGTNSEAVILCDCTSNAITVNLPAAASNTDRVFHIKKTDSTANTVTIDGNSSETIDDSTTKVINTQYDAISIVCDGTEWWII